MRSVRSRRWVTIPILALLAASAGFLLVRWGTGNGGAVEPGRLYRSGQLTPTGLGRTIREKQIRTVINLRGCNPDQPWYRGEVAATLAAGAKQVDVPIASDQWLSREQAREMIRVFDSVEYPALVHCEWGAERTGLASAFATLLRPGSTVEEARRQFSAYYLFLDRKDGRVMYGHLRQYERWLAERGVAHSPETFRGWVDRAYRPEGNSRQLWPCNPISAPGRDDAGEDGRARSVSTWSPARCPEKMAHRGGSE